MVGVLRVCEGHYFLSGLCRPLSLVGKAPTRSDQITHHTTAAANTFVCVSLTIWCVYTHFTQPLTEGKELQNFQYEKLTLFLVLGPGQICVSNENFIVACKNKSSEEGLPSMIILRNIYKEMKLNEAKENNKIFFKSKTVQQIVYFLLDILA